MPPADKTADRGGLTLRTLRVAHSGAGAPASKSRSPCADTLGVCALLVGPGGPHPQEQTKKPKVFTFDFSLST